MSNDWSAAAIRAALGPGAWAAIDGAMGEGSNARADAPIPLLSVMVNRLY